MRNSRLREKFQKIPIYRISLGVLLALLVFDIMKGAICIGWLNKNDILVSLVTILTFVISFIPFFKSHKSKAIGWGNCWVFIAVIIALIIAVMLVNPKNRPNNIEPEKPIIVEKRYPEDIFPQDSIQRRFDGLVVDFKNHINNEELYFANAYQKVSEDFNRAKKIVCMLNEYPGLKAEKKKYYIDIFENRKKVGIDSINKAMGGKNPLLKNQIEDLIRQRELIKQMKVDLCQ